MTSVLSLGSNLGDRQDHLRAGIAVLADRFPVVSVSPIYETAPVGVEDQPAFLNCVAIVDSDDAEAVFSAAQDAERRRHRVRDRRWGPRTLDVDVISVDELVSEDPRLTLPHPRAHERAFVLLPWLDVDPDAQIPGHGRVRDLLDRLPHPDVRRWVP